MFAIAVLGATALFASACSEDSSESSNDAVINAINILSGSGLHGIDDSINEEKEIPASAKTTAMKLEAITRLTEWPSDDDLDTKAEALADVFKEMAAALDGDAPDMAKAGELAKKAHDAEHDFSAEVWAYLYEEAGVEGGGDSH